MFFERENGRGRSVSRTRVPDLSGQKTRNQNDEKNEAKNRICVLFDK